MRLGRDQLRPVNSSLVGFRGMKVQPVCTITLPVVVEAYPKQITKEVNFLVVDCSSSYNAIIGRPPRTKGVDNQAITFTDEDVGRVHHPHDDAIVITLLIADYTTRRVLIDNGSLVDILYYPAFQQMRLGRYQFRLVNTPLVGFGGMNVQLVGTIILPVMVGAYP